MNIPTLFATSESNATPQPVRGDGTVFQSTLIDFLCHGWTASRAIGEADAIETPEVKLAAVETATSTELASEEELEKLMPLEALPFLVDVNDWFASSKLEDARPIVADVSAGTRATVVPAGEASANAASTIVDWSRAPTSLEASLSTPASAEAAAPRSSTQAQPETFAERVARGSSSRPRITPDPRNTLPVSYDLAKPIEAAVTQSAPVVVSQHAQAAALQGPSRGVRPAIEGVAQAAFDMIPLAATPRSLSAAMAEPTARAPSETVTEPSKRPSKSALGASVSRTEMTRHVNAAEADRARDVRGADPAVDTTAVATIEPMTQPNEHERSAADESTIGRTPAQDVELPVAGLFKPAEEGPLREAVLRAVEREITGSRDAAEVRQRDVDSSVDSMTLRHGIVARTVLETGDRVEVAVRPEERGMDVSVRVDSREAAELIALVRHDLIADLEGTRLARVAISYDASLGQSGDRRHEGHRDHQPQRDAESTQEVIQTPATPTQAGRVRVVL